MSFHAHTEYWEETVDKNLIYSVSTFYLLCSLSLSLPQHLFLPPLFLCCCCIPCVCHSLPFLVSLLSSSLPVLTHLKVSSCSAQSQITSGLLQLCTHRSLQQFSCSTPVYVYCWNEDIITDQAGATYFSKAAATSWRPWGLVLFLSQITVLHRESWN